MTAWIHCSTFVDLITSSLLMVINEIWLILLTWCSYVHYGQGCSYASLFVIFNL